MKIINSVREQQVICQELINDKNKISLIPTMGNLHHGHESLLKASINDQYRICSIFINPLQFNDVDDYNNYPKTIDKDIETLKSYKIDYLFLPEKKDIISVVDNFNYKLPTFVNILCGKYRDSHFLGVVQIVKKLFDIIQPSIAYFGKKDYQQLLLIKHLVNNNFNNKIEIIECETIREKNGLAMSSRNHNLSSKKRNIAANVYKELCELKKIIIKEPSQYSAKKIDIIKRMSDLGIKIEYLEVLSRNNLSTPIDISNETNIFVAFYIDQIRMIDNIEI